MRECFCAALSLPICAVLTLAVVVYDILFRFVMIIVIIVQQYDIYHARMHSEFFKCMINNNEHTPF